MLRKIVSRITFSKKTSYALAILSGILFLLSLPPFSFGGFLAWIAFVPLFVTVYYGMQLKRMNRIMTITYLGGFLLLIWVPFWFADLLSFIRFGWPGAPISILQTLVFVVSIPVILYETRDAYGGMGWGYWKPKNFPSNNLQYLLSVFRGRAVLQIFALPLLWTAIEFLIMNIPGFMRGGGVMGFFSIAKTQWANSPVMQLASFTGMYGITFLVLLVNCTVAYAIIHYKETKRIFKPAIIVLGLLALIFSCGLVSIPQKVEGNITVAVIQAPPIEEEDTCARYISFSEKALKYNPQIIVWPAMAFEMISINPYANFSRDHDIYLIGAGEEIGNFSYGVLSPDGSTSMDNLGYHIFTIPRDIMAGDVKSLFFPEVYSLSTDLGNIGVTDCMESASTLPTLDRVRRGAQLLVVPTGSPNAYVFSWALGTNAIYRAVEHRMFAIEVIGDWDASMIIDPYGRIIQDIAPEPEIVVGKISFTNERTFYTKYGDVFGWSIVSLAVALIFYDFYFGRKSQFKFCINTNCMAKIDKDVKTCDKCGKSQKKRPLWQRILWYIFKP